MTLVEALKHEPVRLDARLGRVADDQIGVESVDVGWTALVQLVIRRARGKDTAVELGTEERAKGSDLGGGFGTALEDPDTLALVHFRQNAVLNTGGVDTP